MIKIICVGKIKEKYLEDGIKEYFKRIEGFQKILQISLPYRMGRDNCKPCIKRLRKYCRY